MNNKVVIGILSSVITGLILSFILWVTGTFSDGQDAITDAQIRKIANEEIKADAVMDNGMTEKEYLVQMNNTLIAIRTEQGNMKAALEKLSEE